MDTTPAAEVTDPRGDFATKSDIEQLRRELQAESRLSLRLEHAAAQTRLDFQRTMRQHTMVLVGAMVALASAARIF